jgi:hypothetical protein
VRATLVPRALSSNYDYFKDKVDGISPAGQDSGSSIDRPFEKVSRRDSSGRWTPLWQGSLVNDVAPVDALVANGGKYLITFDNWHHKGYGPDAVVIYDRRGRVIRTITLLDLLPQSFIDTLNTTVSSIHWGRGYFLTDNDETLILRVTEPSFHFGDHNGLTVSVRIRLADGAITPAAGRAWERALRKSKVVRAQQEAFKRKACAEWGGHWCRP